MTRVIGDARLTVANIKILVYGAGALGSVYAADPQRGNREARRDVPAWRLEHDDRAGVHGGARVA
jgi:hypothetical protein